MRDSRRPDLERFPALAASWSRRELIRNALAGAALAALGGAMFLPRDARADKRKDGRDRLPPGQRALDALRAMGGDEGDPDPKSFKLRVHGACKSPFEVDYANLLKLPQVEKQADVHCVTGWSLLGATYKGVQISALADLAKMKGDVKFVILEAAHGYTANVPLAEATTDNALVTYRIDGKPFSTEHGAPVRALIPDLYFWKSSKWLTGVRFVREDEPGYWETRGYHNHADPWKEERYS